MCVKIQHGLKHGIKVVDLFVCSLMSVTSSRSKRLGSKNNNKKMRFLFMLGHDKAAFSLLYGPCIPPVQGQAMMLLERAGSGVETTPFPSKASYSGPHITCGV